MASCFLRFNFPPHSDGEVSASYADGGVRSYITHAAHDPSVVDYRATSPYERGGIRPSFLRIVVPVQEARIGIEAQTRAGRHVERGLPARVAKAVGVHRIVGFDGGEVALAFRDRQHMQRGKRGRADE